MRYSSNCEEDNELKRKTDELSSDTDIDIENNFFYEKDGKKNYILGKLQENFGYSLYLRFCYDKKRLKNYYIIYNTI